MSEINIIHDWFCNVNILLCGAAEEINAVCAAVKTVITDVPFDAGESIQISETRTIVCEDDVRKLAIAVSKAAPNAGFEMNGLINTESTAGELMDFCVKFKNDSLSAAFSDWYIEAYMPDYESYEDFCDSFCDCTPEEYEALADCEYVYLVETEDGEKLCAEVTLGEAETLAY